MHVLRNVLRGLTALAVVAVGGAAMGQFTEQFETPFAVNPGGPPGATVALSSGSWYFINGSSPIGSTGVNRLPEAAGGTMPFAVNPGDGSFYASMNFHNGSSVANIDSYFMTPVMTLSNGDTLSFITRTATDTSAPTFPDRLFVKMSTNGASTSPADFSTTLLAINESVSTVPGAYPQTWTEFTATVSGLGGPTSGRLAFNYNVPNAGPLGDNSNIIGIDRATYTLVPEPASLCVAAGAGLLAMRRRRN